jgi:hypothetical protein
VAVQDIGLPASLQQELKRSLAEEVKTDLEISQLNRQHHLNKEKSDMLCLP